MKITSALPLEFIVGNIVRRILNIVREEYTSARKVNYTLNYTLVLVTQKPNKIII